MKEIKIVILACFWSFIVRGQNSQHQVLLTIPLETIYGDSSWIHEGMLTSTIKNPHNYILPRKYKTYRVAAVILNTGQEYYERLRQGTMSAEAFSKLPKGYNIDTSILYKGVLKGNRINVFTAIDSVNKYVIVDANNNYSFLDDSVYVFPLKDQNPKHPKLHVSITKYDGRRQTTLSVPVIINPFDNNAQPTELERELDLRLNTGSMRVGNITVNGKLYQIGLNNRNFGFTPSNNTDFRLAVRQVPPNPNDFNDYFYLPDDDIEVGGNIYNVVKVTDSTLTLRFIRKSENGGGRLHTKAPAFEMPDMTNAQSYKLNLHAQKYTIIDFWGSWCEPCIEELPRLTALHTEYAYRVNFVSIAYDYSKNIEKLKGLIVGYKLNWPQLWVERLDRKNNPVADYKVDTFPTTVLLDGNGMIIYRATNADELENIAKILNDKLGR